MSGIDWDFMCHHLTLDPSAKLFKQRKQKVSKEKRHVVKEGTQKLIKADHIREIQYPEWLANVVTVKKASKKLSGPYRIKEVIRNEAYKLETLDGGTTPNVKCVKSEILF